jgi:copper chaperone CopZ
MFSKNIVTTIFVDGMHCAHCAGRVKTALLALNGVKSVDVNLETKAVTITSKTALDPATLSSTISTLGYTMAE